MKTLEEMWQLYRAHLHGYDPNAEAELEAAFKSGGWCFLQALKTLPRLELDQVRAIEMEYTQLKERRREKE